MLEEWKTLLLELLLVDGFAESEVGSFLIFVFCLESLSIQTKWMVTMTQHTDVY